jgi:hypothetical protein
MGLDLALTYLAHLGNLGWMNYQPCQWTVNQETGEECGKTPTEPVYVDAVKEPEREGQPGQVWTVRSAFLCEEHRPKEKISIPL